MRREERAVRAGPAEGADGYTIRPAGPEDLREIVRMRGELQAHLARANGLAPVPSPQAQAAYAESSREKLGRAGCLWLVAEDSHGRAVGMGEINEVFDPDRAPERTAKINDVWVEPAHRGRGLATAIAELLLVFARSHGLERVWLNWVAGNGEAESFWPRLGFRPALVMAVREGDPEGDGQRAVGDGPPSEGGGRGRSGPIPS